MGNLSRDMREAIGLQSVSDSVLSQAIRLTQEHALRALDAIHMSSALGAKASIPDDAFYFWGSDNRLNTACEDSDLQVLNPEDTDF